MSRIASTSGVRVAAQPMNNIYTVLLLVALLALVFTLAYTLYILQHYYGGSAGYGEEVDQDLQGARGAIQAGQENCKEFDKWLEAFPAGGAAPAPASGTPPAAPAAGAVADPLLGT